ncbi:MAG: cytochrome P450 [Caldilineae bacterium]|nr:cytochrome P450 [Anaerolineae bacterium]MCB0199295.1 cytochrome P450 [Anaerolineae bacterium]MCB0204126.1 cytochrome P450 [Anaerolineae bacterium]MCB0252788.1 cytochrome P450 [Anaerolineae bacterium]MCB9154508.1 cytochrome P450 [Caldilineae bacterium]
MSKTMTAPMTTQRQAPGPQQNLLLGALIGSRDGDTISFYMDLWRKYGDLARVKMGPMAIHLIVNPDHVRHVLVERVDNYPKGMSHDKLRIALGNGLLTSDNPLWKYQRKLMQPTYTPKGIAQFGDIMVDAADQMLARWRVRSNPDAALVVNQEMMRLAMSVISRSTFGLDISEDFKEAGQALMTILEFASARSMSFIDPPLFVPTPMNRRFKQALETIDNFLYGIIHERQRQGPGDDLLSLLMTARDEETGAVMDEKQLRDEVLITFFAGHETTAQLLTWTWYLLSKHPHVEEKLHAEVDTVLNGRQPNLDDVKDLVYTRQILDETLRLYSPVAIMARDPLADDEIDGCLIPGGSMVTIMPFITHRHPAFWDNPEGFMPERFEPAEIKKRPRYAYYPFGAGPRICIGQHFALLEATLVLAELAQHYRLKLVPGLWVEPQFMGTLRPSRDVLMTLEERRA